MPSSGVDQSTYLGRRSMGFLWRTADATSQCLTDSDWGDGLEELSLTTLWYPCSWRDVAQDELLLYLPSLAHESGVSASGSPNERVRLHLQDALCARILHGVRDLGAGGDRSRSGRETVHAFTTAVEGILQTHVADVLTVSAALKRGELIYRDWFAVRGIYNWPFRRVPKAADTSNDARIELELLIIATMAAYLAAGVGKSPKSLKSDFNAVRCGQVGSPELPENAWNVLAALHTGLNPAYLFPDLQVYHGLFTMAGWLGWLDRGRKAYLPAFVAEYLIDVLERDRQGSKCNVVDALLNYYAERVGGAAFLLKAARRVTNRGGALLVKPRALIWQSEVGRAMELLAEFARSEASDGRLPLIDRSTPGFLFPEPSLERR